MVLTSVHHPGSVTSSHWCNAPCLSETRQRGDRLGRGQIGLKCGHVTRWPIEIKHQQIQLHRSHLSPQMPCFEFMTQAVFGMSDALHGPSRTRPKNARGHFDKAPAFLRKSPSQSLAAAASARNKSHQGSSGIKKGETEQCW